ncbi:YqhR family membrane protein [Oceanobacillus senegalensis]|uniref:YqhR family membrane protein n=1 Tax=Oceanobacillus senegalensis TaxID=1936063 RepID=UPI000A310EC7|nr:YqhR family membrane protein [Oceanobacillus senegalensis]
MAEDNKKLEQNKRNEEQMSILARSLLTGFIGGIFWSTVGVFLYYFNFSELSPKAFLLRSWLRTDWTSGWLGDLVSIILVGLLSLATALIYYGTLRKVNSMWVGALYGIVLWGIIFYLFQPIFTNVPGVFDLKTDTIVTTLCIYILYGTFIGYSISYDYHDMKMQES